MNGFYTGEIDDELFLDVAVVTRAGEGQCTTPIKFGGISTEDMFSRGIRINILDEYA